MNDSAYETKSIYVATWLYGEGMPPDHVAIRDGKGVFIYNDAVAASNLAKRYHQFETKPAKQYVEDLYKVKGLLSIARSGLEGASV